MKSGRCAVGVIAILSALAVASPARPQQPIDPVDFRPFAVRAAGGFAWDGNARERAARLIRILPPDRLKIGANTLWPEYRLLLSQQGVVDGRDTVVPTGFCARGDMSVDDALQKP